MAKSTMNLQDSFLNQVRKDNLEITIVMLDGLTLKGHVRGFDNFTVILNADDRQHLLYKHAIAQIIQPRVRHGETRRPQREGSRSRKSEEGNPAAHQTEDPAAKGKFNAIDLSDVRVSGEATPSTPSDQA